MSEEQQQQQEQHQSQEVALEQPVSAEQSIPIVTTNENSGTSYDTSTKPAQAVPALENNEPAVTPANASRGGRETSDRILYVGNLDLTVTEEMLRQYFQVGGSIANVKILMDKNNKEANYAFVEFHKPHDANVAFQTLDGKQIENRVVKINWAFQSQQVSSEDTFNLFVGDLSVDVDDEKLANTFKDVPTFIQAHVMWDMQTGRSRGYGFVSFGDQSQAQKAMEHSQGTVVNGRAIRINWASKREHSNNNSNISNSHNNGDPYQMNSRGSGPRRGGFRGHSNNQFRNPMAPMGMPPTRGAPMPAMGIPTQAPLSQGPQPQGPVMLPQAPPQAVEAMIRSAPLRVTTVYIGNIPHFASEQDLIPLLQNFGFIVDFKHYADRGCCFVKYGTHEQAAVCILTLGNFPFQGRNFRTGWGKEKPTYIPQPKSEVAELPMGQIPVQNVQPEAQELHLNMNTEQTQEESQ
ncbi:LANO_0H06084g1_1 [Lachancea nothofagi CBS 11611]|uniref:LANO_0H06084g1_1 n=1 Tax=Lachancea nothofagi CBS 11611 TaxID=1266666 RepID=A0A1G4KLV0_9SACH|nr:LANO_0H06084g1_1 [Lachancea nothofagi CBS 11611]